MCTELRAPVAFFFSHFMLDANVTVGCHVDIVYIDIPNVCRDFTQIV